jgi:hypothetical protein
MQSQIFPPSLKRCHAKFGDQHICPSRDMSLNPWVNQPTCLPMHSVPAYRALLVSIQCPRGQFEVSNTPLWSPVINNQLVAQLQLIVSFRTNLRAPIALICSCPLSSFHTSNMVVHEYAIIRSSDAKTILRRTYYLFLYAIRGCNYASPSAVLHTQVLNTYLLPLRTHTIRPLIHHDPVFTLTSV